jgi:hypothetical protein
MKIAVCILLLFSLSWGSFLPVAYGQDAPTPGETVVMTEVLLADPEPQPIFVPPPPLIEPGSVTASAVQSLAITINYNPTGTGRCEVTVIPWPNEARAALEYAVRIWSSLLSGDRPIVIDVCWTTVLGGGLLAQGGSGARPADFTGAPQANTTYPVALANQLSDSDLNGAAVEFQIRFNANQSWYFGTDGQVPALPAGQFDFVTVALHEIGHPLAYEGSARWDDGATPNECNGNNGEGCYPSKPGIYDRFVQNTAGQTLLNLTNNSVTLGNQLTGNALVFGGPSATAANGNAAPRLFAPATWAPGSSYAHLDEATFNGTAHALMTPTFNAREAIHHPGEVTLGLLRDLGWFIPNIAATFANAENTGYEDGTFLYPFNTAEEAVNAVPDGGVVFFVAGNYPGALTVIRPMVLQSPGGRTVLGGAP